MNRIYELRKNKGWTQEELGKALGVTKVTISSYERGTRQPNPEMLSAIANIFGVSVDVLLGRGNTEQSSSAQWPKTITPAKKPVGRNYKRFPVYAFLACGSPEDMTDYIIDEIYLDDSVWEGRDVMVARTQGDSMAPSIKSGDQVVIDRSDIEPFNGKIYAVQVNGDTATLKQVFVSEDGIDLVPMNPAYQKMHFTAEQCAAMPVRILGRLVYSERKW